jgi:hypothetical protein
MDTVEVDSIYEYLEIVTSLSKCEIDIWFRGSSSIEYGLLPGLYWRDQAKWERNFVHKFLVRYKAYVKEPIENPWEIFALMQHHGLPTRLLDWSKSPLSALFFALTKEPNRDGNRVVWILPPDELNKASIGTLSLFCPAVLQSRNIQLKGDKEIDLDSYLPQALDPSDNYRLPVKPIAIESPLSGERITAQQGCFTLHGSSLDGLEKQFTKEEPPCLAAIILKTKGNLGTFLEPLLSWGINEETIYQDLDSMTRNILRLEGIS